MEPRAELDPEELAGMAPSPDAGPHEYFRKARELGYRFYKSEIDYIRNTSFDDLTPEQFFTEYVWVVHATGFNAKVVGKLMPRLMEAYGDFRDLARADEELRGVLAVCNNPQKAKAVKLMAEKLDEALLDPGWGRYKRSDLSSPELLRRLHFIGPVTCYHLARNIGLLEFVKPDLHLVRMAAKWGYADCREMCSEIRSRHAELHGEFLPLGIVDLILWYGASHWGTLGMREEGAR